MTGTKNLGMMFFMDAKRFPAYRATFRYEFVFQSTLFRAINTMRLRIVESFSALWANNFCVPCTISGRQAFGLMYFLVLAFCHAL